MASVYAGYYVGQFVFPTGVELTGASFFVVLAGTNTHASLYVDGNYSAALTNPLPPAAGPGLVGVDETANVRCYADSTQDYDVIVTVSSPVPFVYPPFRLSMIPDGRVMPLPAGTPAVGDTSTVTATDPDTGLATEVSWVSSVGTAVQDVATPVGVGGPLVVNKLNPVNAAAAPLVMTLPTGQVKGSLLSVVKTDTTANSVKVIGNIRGVPSSSVSLVDFDEGLLFQADSAGSWWPVADHKTLSSLRGHFDAKLLSFFATLGGNLLFWDDFRRPNQSLSGDNGTGSGSVPPSVNGIAAYTYISNSYLRAAIVNGRYVRNLTNGIPGGISTFGANGASFLYYNLGTPFTVVAAKVVFTPLPTWRSNTAYLSGYAILASPGNGFAYACTTAGTSGATPPVFPTTVNATVVDGAAVWSCQGASTLTQNMVVGATTPALFSTSSVQATVGPTSWELFYTAKPALLLPWSAARVVQVGTLVRAAPDNGHYYSATTAGVAGAVAPTFPTTTGATVADGTCVWTCQGATSSSTVIISALTGPVSFAVPLTADGVTAYDIQLRWDPVTSSVYLYVEEVLIGSYSGPEVNAFWSTTVGFQIRRNIATDGDIQVLAVAVAAPLATSSQPYGSLLYLPGVATVTTSTSAPSTPVTDLDVRFLVAPTLWRAVSNQCVVGQWSKVLNGVGDNSYNVQITSTGALMLQYTTDGATQVNVTSTAIPGIVDNTIGVWCRVTYQISSGTVTFYTAPDGVTWTSFRTVSTGTTALWVSGQPLAIGARDPGNLPFAGRIAVVQDLAGIGGPLRAGVDYRGSWNGTDTAGNTWSMNGKGWAWVTDITSVPNLSADLAALAAEIAALGGGSPQPIPGAIIDLPGDSTDYPSTPRPATALSGDVDLIGFVSPAGGFASNYCVVSCWGASTNLRCFSFEILSSGLLKLLVSLDGSSAITVQSTIAVPVGTVAVEAQRVQSTGTVTFLTSADGVTFTQLGTTRSTTAGALFASTAEVQVGARDTTGTDPFSGYVSAALVLNGIGGTLWAGVDLRGKWTGTDGAGNVWTFNGVNWYWAIPEVAIAGLAASLAAVTGGVTISGTPSAGQMLTATSASAADWQSPGGVTAPIGLASVADPSTPVAANLDLYPFQPVGASKPFWKVASPTGRNYLLQPSLAQRYIAMIAAGTGTAVSTFGCGATSAGTVSHPAMTNTFGWAANFVTAATTGSTAGTGTANAQFLRGSATTDAAGFLFFARLAFPDSSYGSGSTGFRFFVGFTDYALATAVGQDDPNGGGSAGGCAGFSYSTNRADTSILIATATGSGASTLASTTMAFTAQHVYDFYLYLDPDGANLYWRIDDITAATTANCDASPVTAALPSAGAVLRAGCQIATLSNTALDIRMQKIYVESDR